jgi:hypothetical protein
VARGGADIDPRQGLLGHGRRLDPTGNADEGERAGGDAAQQVSAEHVTVILPWRANAHG